MELKSIGGHLGPLLRFFSLKYTGCKIWIVVFFKIVQMSNNNASWVDNSPPHEAPGVRVIRYASCPLVT